MFFILYIGICMFFFVFLKIDSIFDFVYLLVIVFSLVLKKEFKIYFFKFLLKKIFIGEKNVIVFEFFVFDFLYDFSILFFDFDFFLILRFFILY